MNFAKSALFTLSAAVLGSLLLGLVAAPAYAASVTTTFQVTATVQATCTVSATTLAFGTYSGVQVDQTGTITATCTNTTPYTVALDPGTATGATVTTRKMTGPGSALLNYALYRDAAHTNNWGNTVGTDTVAGTGNGSGQTITVYGRLAGAQYVTPGAYADTITATVAY